MGSEESSVYPKYRLRLFLSADLAGSTAFKAGDGKRPARGGASQPLWVETIRHFYQEFPRLIQQNYRASRQDLELSYPKVWKTVGDEIVFCCRLTDTAHLSACMNAFLKALSTFGLDLQGRALSNKVKGLDVKGTAWLAAFPHPNVTVALDIPMFKADQFDEKFEQNADENPRSVDFLGNGIDCGFRIATRSTVDRCPISAELAYLLAREAEQSKFEGKFSHYERFAFRGVLGDKPYPVVFLETERSEARRRVRHHENRLTGAEVKSLAPIDVHTFFESFLTDEGIDLPVLPAENANVDQILPESYLQYRDDWIKDVNELRERRATERASENADHDGDGDIPEAVRNSDLTLPTTPDQQALLSSGGG